MENCDVIIPLCEKNKKEDLIKSLNSLIVERNFIKNIFLVIDGCKNYPNYLPTKHVLKSNLLINLFL